MAALPSGTAAYQTATRSLHIAVPGDFVHGYPGTDSARLLVPFGTRVLGVHGLLGTVQSGSIEQAADKVTRGDGEGGIEAKAFKNLRFVGELTCTFRIMYPDSGITAGDPSGGVGPVKIGDFITLQAPKQGVTFTAPASGTVAAVTGLEDKVFTVENVKFNFTDGEYANYTISLEHNVGLETDAGVTRGEVSSAGLLVAKSDDEYGA